MPLSDGRFISVLRRPMPGGGLVSTHEDVTEREELNARLADQNALLRRHEKELEAQNERFDAALPTCRTACACSTPSSAW